MQGFSGISLFSVLLLMGLGLALIFGQMGVINMAHGEFMALGAYTVYLCSHLTAEYAPAFGPYYFIFAILLAFIVSAGLGALVEWAMIRHLYHRPLDTLLATWGLSLILQQAYRSIFGAREVSPTLPDWLMGSFQPTEGIDIPINGVFVLGLAGFVCAAVLLFSMAYLFDQAAFRGHVSQWSFLWALPLTEWITLAVAILLCRRHHPARLEPIFPLRPIED